MTDPRAAREALTDHPYYRYRGCAPDPEHPRMAAGDPDVGLEAWGPYTGEGAEPQRDRIGREREALGICGRCPVLAACRAYGHATVRDAAGVEHLAEPEGILGGELALTRHRALIARRHAETTAAVAGSSSAASTVPLASPSTVTSAARTAQKRAVLRALARETEPELVAVRAGMDVRSANWHRSGLTTLLGLDREHATRDQLLAAAVEAGLLPRSIRIRPDGRWPVAAAPTTDGIRQRRIGGRGRPVQLMLPGLGGLARVVPAPVRPECAPDRLRRALGLRLVRPAARPVPLTLTVLEPAA